MDRIKTENDKAIELFVDILFFTQQKNVLKIVCPQINDKHIKDYYESLVNPHRYAIIVCNYDFPGDNYLPTSPMQLRSIKKVFRDMHFKPKLIVNKSRDFIINKLNKIAEKKKMLSKHDSLALYVLSQGAEKGFLTIERQGKEPKLIRYDEVINIFTNENCELLIGKPKLFFFNCCTKGTGFLFNEIIIHIIFSI